MTSKRQAQQAAKEYDAAAKGFANKRKTLKDIDSPRAAEAARMAKAAQDMRRIADSL
jgi:hypothetical protein